jgi:hypothetical protein
MITNECQYGITKAALEKFEASLALNEQSDPALGVHPRIHAAAGDALRSEAGVLMTPRARTAPARLQPSWISSRVRRLGWRR